MSSNRSTAVAFVIALAASLAAACSMGTPLQSSPRLMANAVKRAAPTARYPVGSIYVADNPGFNRGSIDIFAASAHGNVAPLGVITVLATLLTAPFRPPIDSTGRIIVPNAGSAIQIYAPGANGNVAPVVTISGSNTGLNFPENLALDAAGNMWVANSGANNIEEFAS